MGIPYYWVAKFGDDLVQQFDPVTGIENMYSVVLDRLDELTEVGWHPVTEELISLIHKYNPNTSMIVSQECDSLCIDVPDGRGCDVRIVRRNYISYGFTLTGEKRNIVFVLGLQGDDAWYFMGESGDVFTDTDFNTDLEILIGF